MIWTICRPVIQAKKKTDIVFLHHKELAITQVLLYLETELLNHGIDMSRPLSTVD